MLVFIAVEPATWTATIILDVGFVGGEQRAGDFTGKLLAFGGVEGFLLRGHLAFLDDVIDVRPAFAVMVIGWIKGQGGEIDVTLGGLLVVALEAGLFDAWQRSGLAKLREAGQASNPDGAREQGSHLNGGWLWVEALRRPSWRPLSRRG